MNTEALRPHATINSSCLASASGGTDDAPSLVESRDLLKLRPPASPQQAMLTLESSGRALRGLDFGSVLDEKNFQVFGEQRLREVVALTNLALQRQETIKLVGAFDALRH